jgi:hypothetical protein
MIHIYMDFVSHTDSRLFFFTASTCFVIFIPRTRPFQTCYKSCVNSWSILLKMMIYLITRSIGNRATSNAYKFVVSLRTFGIYEHFSYSYNVKSL